MASSDTPNEEFASKGTGKEKNPSKVHKRKYLLLQDYSLEDPTDEMLLGKCDHTHFYNSLVFTLTRDARPGESEQIIVGVGAVICSWNYGNVPLVIKGIIRNDGLGIPRMEIEPVGLPMGYERPIPPNPNPNFVQLTGTTRTHLSDLWHIFPGVIVDAYKDNQFYLEKKQIHLEKKEQKRMKDLLSRRKSRQKKKAAESLQLQKSTDSNLSTSAVTKPSNHSMSDISESSLVENGQSSIDGINFAEAPAAALCTQFLKYMAEKDKRMEKLFERFVEEVKEEREAQNEQYLKMFSMITKALVPKPTSIPTPANMPKKRPLPPVVSPRPLKRVRKGKVYSKEEYVTTFQDNSDTE